MLCDRRLSIVGLNDAIASFVKFSMALKKLTFTFDAIVDDLVEILEE